jgi:hypothetical protein
MLHIALFRKESCLEREFLLLYGELHRSSLPYTEAAHSWAGHTNNSWSLFTSRHADSWILHCRFVCSFSVCVCTKYADILCMDRHDLSCVCNCQQSEVARFGYQLRHRLLKTLLQFSSFALFQFICKSLLINLPIKYRLRGFRNWVLGRIFGPKRDEVTEEWRKL